MDLGLNDMQQFGTQSGNMTRQKRLAQMLMQQEQNAGPVQSHSQGLASVFRNFLAGQNMRADDSNQRAAQEAMMNAVTQPSGPRPGVASGARQQPTLQQRLMSAASSDPSNPYLAQMGVPLAMQGAQREQELADKGTAFQRDMQLEEMKRKLKLGDDMDLLKIRDGLSRQSDTAKAVMEQNAKRAEYGLPPISAMPGQTQPSQQASPSASMQPAMGQANAMPPPATLAEAKTQAAANEARMKGEATADGKAYAEDKTALRNAETALPRLEESVAKLRDLGKTATYTLGGQAGDYLSKELLGSATEGSKSRSAYIAHVKNNVLPLLRDTFGAAFTAAEGDSLLATLGDPNMHPDVKNAVLDAFIADKKADLEVKRSRVNGTPYVTEDQRAVEWAKAHLDDPRAAQIMQMHGGK